ncbi:GGDEF domain-containing protein [Marinomonas sp. M1K-6]|uniref:diguanylate cyclase n=1 Tax=Marinomonas profundi TaxID=2726122 RepID=A0A847RBU4_9GAMM|nr:GGDEF domain-containing protein [Marinomonas profundi]NLQ18737.1 GGDEF domain-containing protein [Marinomonas profundi]UDV04017.1 GGDEF domain-containing protein [Marinomonas profundi]
MNAQRYPQTSVSPETLHKWLSALLCVLNSVYFLLNMLLVQKLGLGGIQLISAFFGGYCFFASLKGQYQPWHSYTLMTILSVNILASASIMELVAGAIFWSLALPIWYYSLFGLKKGICFSAVVMVSTATILFLRTDTSLFMPYRTVFNFTLAYLSIWLVCHLYEVQRQKTSAFLHSLALEDALTGIHNRHALKTDFSAIRKKFTRIHMLIIDIDHFKRINDTFGHDIGDAVLINLANVLKQSLNTSDIYRLGGEEFVVLFKEMEDIQAKEWAEKIRQAIEQEIFHSHKEEIKLTVSIGISALQPQQEFTDFLRAADEKLYQAKHEGRNKVCF